MVKLSHADYVLLLAFMVAGHLLTPAWTAPVVIAYELVDGLPDSGLRTVARLLLAVPYGWHSADGPPWAALAFYVPCVVAINVQLARYFNRHRNALLPPRGPGERLPARRLPRAILVGGSAGTDIREAGHGRRERAEDGLDVGLRQRQVDP